MQVKVGHWANGLGVEFRREDAEHLICRFGVDFSVELTDRVLVISPASKGNCRMTYFGQRNQPGFTHVLQPHGLISTLPHFELVDMELDEQGDGEEYYLAAELPADHELPWPSKRSFKAFENLTDLASFCEDQVQMRCNSAVASGSNIQAIPAHIRERAAPGLYLRCLSTAKQLSGMS